MYSRAAMARVGAEMVNPITGERFVWRHTASSTGGAFAECDLFLAPGAMLAAAHVHPRQREDFRVERGEIWLRVAAAGERLTAGARRSVSQNTAHAWRNAGLDEAHVVVRLTPALRSEDSFETFCGLARAGRAGSKGLPRNPLQTEVLAHAFRAEFALPSRVARVLLAPLVVLLASIGRTCGLRARYPQFSSDV